MTSALAILSTLRARGARVRIAGERIGIEPGSVLDADLAGAVRAHREELRRILAADRTAAEWRARYEILAAHRQLVDGYDGNAARRWAYFELLCEWTEAHRDDPLPSARAESIARAALEALGICEFARSPLVPALNLPHLQQVPGPAPAVDGDRCQCPELNNATPSERLTDGRVCRK